MKVYMIRHKHDPSKYFRGTPTYGSYGKEGRIFRSIGQLRTFITSCMNNRYSRSLDEMIVVEYDLIEGGTKEVHEIVTPKRLVELITK